MFCILQCILSRHQRQSELSRNCVCVCVLCAACMTRTAHKPTTSLTRAAAAEAAGKERLLRRQGKKSRGKRAFSPPFPGSASRSGRVQARGPRQREESSHRESILLQNPQKHLMAPIHSHRESDIVPASTQTDLQDTLPKVPKVSPQRASNLFTTSSAAAVR